MTILTVSRQPLSDALPAPVCTPMVSFFRCILRPRGPASISAPPYSRLGAGPQIDARTRGFNAAGRLNLGLKDRRPPGQPK